MKNGPENPGQSDVDIFELAAIEARKSARARPPAQRGPLPHNSAGRKPNGGSMPTATVLEMPQPRQVQKQPPRELRILDPALWEGAPIPARRWRVLTLIPERAVTILSGPGAAGKSTIAMQLLAAMAIGQPWLGFQTAPGRSLYLSAEDDEDELHRRMEAVRAYYGTDFRTLGEHCRLVDLVGQDSVLAALSRDQLVVTELYGLVETYVAAWRPGLVIVDALADVFGGNEIVRAQVRQFITMLRHLCLKYDCEVLLLAHPSLAGMAQDGTGLSGSTGWGNSARGVLYFAAPPEKSDEPRDDSLRSLTVKKANYAPTGEPLTLRYQSGVFVPEGGGSSLDKKERDRRAEEVFLALLSAYTDQQRYVSASPCSTFAPKVFARDARADGLSKAALDDAMNRLFAAKRLTTARHGPPSSQRRHIVFVEPNNGGPQD